MRWRLLAAGLLLAGCEGPPPVEKPAVGPPPAEAVPVLRLAPGILDEARLQAGEERAYLLDLTAGQYAELVVDQQGIDVAVSLQAPDGRTLAAVDSPKGAVGTESLPVVAAASGQFRLEIRSLAPGAPAGRYVLRLDASRPATARDRVRVEAERVLAASEELRLQGDPAPLRRAVQRERQALARFHALGLRERQAEALFCLGLSHHGLGELDTAAGYYRQALALFRARGDGPWSGIILGNLGHLERSLGRPARALALYREALSLHRRFRNRQDEALILNNLGRAARDLGETGEAVQAFEQALSLSRALGDRMAEGKMLSNLGDLETSLGQLPRALEHLGQAVALLEALGDRRGLGVALSHLGMARALAGRPRDEVLPAFQRALQLQRETGDRRREIVTLHNLGWYHNREGEIRQAEQIFRETLDLFHAQRNPAGEAASLVNLGNIELELGRLARAEETFTRARALLTEIGDPLEEANALFGLARVRRAAGRTAEALADIEGVSARIETLRRKPVDLDERLTFFASKQDIYGLRVDLLMELHRRDPRAGYDARALLASEEARARTLLDLLEEAHIGLGSRAVALPGAQALGLREIQRQVVEQGTLLLEYHLGTERSFLWAVTPEAIESFELPPRGVLEAEARRAAFLLGASSRALARRQTELALAGLSHRLLRPVAHRLREAERLVIVPDGALWSLSFAALPDPAASGASGDRPPLVVGHEIVILPSLSTVSRLRRGAAGRRPAPGTIAVVADPVFTPTDPRVRTPGPAARSEDAQRDGPAAPLARLPFSRAEAQAILSMAPPAGRLAALDFAASRDTVLSGSLARYRIVHFATHAVLNTENPELSGIVLSRVDPHGRPRDGFLRLAEIYRLDLPADLVVLSACRTALGREIRGEGLVGLTRGFFSAGARQVVVSLWPVEDRSTAELMQRFYREMLGRGRPPAAALRAAQTAMWRDEGWRSAYYWAGFILQGDWRAPANKPDPPGEDLYSARPQPKPGG